MDVRLNVQVRTFLDKCAVLRPRQQQQLLSAHCCGAFVGYLIYDRSITGLGADDQALKLVNQKINKQKS